MVMVLAFMAFVGLVVFAVLSYSDTSYKLSSQTRDVEQRTAAADGGAKFGLASLLQSTASCSSTNPAAPSAMAGAPQTNGFMPAVTCYNRNATIYTDSTGWGIYITNPNGQIATQSGNGNGDVRNVNGPVYNGSTSADAWDLKSTMKISNGGALRKNPPNSPSCATPNNLVLVGSGTYACTPPVEEPTQPPPTQALPESPNLLPIRSSGGNNDPSCRVFEPGWYATPPALVNQNYFKSGVYFFQQGIGDVQGKDLLAGWFPASGGVESVAITALESMPCRVATDTTGVQFIFGGDGYLKAANNSRVEIFSMAKGDTVGTSIYQLTATDGGDWLAYISTRGVGSGNAIFNQALVSRAGGNNADIVLHGLVYVPGGTVDLPGTNNTLAQIRGGLVAGAAKLQGAASLEFPGINISAGEEFSAIHYVITSTVATSGGKTVKVQSVVRLPADDPTNPIIYSWVVT